MSKSYTLKDIRDVGLEEHNKIRKAKGVPPIKGNLMMHEHAQSHCDYLADSNKFESTTMGVYGNMISNSIQPDPTDAVRDAFKRWSSSSIFFNFLQPGCDNMGIGIARNSFDDRWIIVTFYEVPGMKRKI